MNVDPKQIMLVKIRIKHDISSFQRKTNSTLLIKLKKILYGPLTNYFFFRYPTIQRFL